MVVGPQRLGINEEVAAASDNDHANLGVRTFHMLNFGRIGLNCEALACAPMSRKGQWGANMYLVPRCNIVGTFLQDGHASVMFKRLSSSTRYKQGSLRNMNSTFEPGIQRHFSFQLIHVITFSVVIFIGQCGIRTVKPQTVTIRCPAGWETKEDELV